MAVLVLLGLILAFIGGSDATWCVCKSEVADNALQKTLDYACGAGADCTPVLQNGPCYNPNTVKGHCSYAANSYFQRKGQAAGTCDFQGTASVTTTDPSYPGCSYASTASASGTPTTGTSTTGTPTTFSPNGNGVVGGLGPSGTGISTDGSDGGILPKAEMGSLSTAIMLSGLVLFLG